MADGTVQMELSRIIISEMKESQIIMLREVDGEREFPIVIGSAEAFAIDRRLKGIATPRPLLSPTLKCSRPMLTAKRSAHKVCNLPG